jgi:ribonuclease HII
MNFNFELQNKYGVKMFYQPEKIEIGIDEAGRGPLFGRLYVAAVVLPKDGSFDFSHIRDSKKITSKKKIVEIAEYIRTASLAWHVEFVESLEIDQINIRQAVLKGMRECIRSILEKLETKGLGNDVFLLIDGNDFTGYPVFDEATNTLTSLPFETVPGGDNLFASIAAASILAKTARDAYIRDLCSSIPALDAKYGLGKNMGYGTKTHLDGILEHGISQWHRKTYGRCKEATLNEI